MSAVAYLHVFTLVKMFAPGASSVIQDFANVWDLVSIFAALYLVVCPHCAPSCQYIFVPAQCAEMREMENKTARA